MNFGLFSHWGSWGNCQLGKIQHGYYTKSRAWGFQLQPNQINCFNELQIPTTKQHIGTKYKIQNEKYGNQKMLRFPPQAKSKKLLQWIAQRWITSHTSVNLKKEKNQEQPKGTKNKCGIRQREDWDQSKKGRKVC